MPNYQNGKIYTIRSRSREDLIYVGSTTRRLSERLGQHKRAPAKTSSKCIIEIGDSYIELYENFSCNSREELNKREGDIIRLINCVNKNIPGRCSKERYEDNKEEVLKNMKHYYKDNKVERLEKIKEYYEQNKEDRIKYAKEYRTKNNETLSEKYKKKFTCKCGKTLRWRDKARHNKTKYHKNNI